MAYSDNTLTSEPLTYSELKDDNPPAIVKPIPTLSTKTTKPNYIPMTTSKIKEDPQPITTESTLVPDDDKYTTTQPPGETTQPPEKQPNLRRHRHTQETQQPPGETTHLRETDRRQPNHQEKQKHKRNNPTDRDHQKQPNLQEKQPNHQEKQPNHQDPGETTQP